MIRLQTYRKMLKLDDLYTVCKTYRQAHAESKKTRTKSLIEGVFVEWESLLDKQLKLADLKKRISHENSKVTYCYTNKDYYSTTSENLLRNYMETIAPAVQAVLDEIEELDKKFRIKIVSKKNLAILTAAPVSQMGKDAILKYLSREDCLPLADYMVKQLEKNSQKEAQALRDELEGRTASKRKQIQVAKEAKKRLFCQEEDERERLQGKICKRRNEIQKIESAFKKEKKIPSELCGKRGWLYDAQGRPQKHPTWLFSFVSVMNDAEWKVLEKEQTSLIATKGWNAEKLAKIRRSAIRITFLFPQTLISSLANQSNRELLLAYGNAKMSNSGGLRSKAGQFAVTGLDVVLRQPNEEATAEERMALSFINDVVDLYFAFYVPDTLRARVTASSSGSFLELNKASSIARISSPKTLSPIVKRTSTMTSPRGPRYDLLGMTPTRVDSCSEQIEMLMNIEDDSVHHHRGGLPIEDAEKEKVTLTLLQNFLLFMEGCESKVTAFSQKVERLQPDNEILRQLEQDLQKINALSRIQTNAIRTLLEDILSKDTDLAEPLSQLSPRLEGTPKPGGENYGIQTTPASPRKIHTTST